MWVRSQDKTELINTKRLQVEDERIYVYTESDEDYWEEIAEYDTFERAIEVLNLAQANIMDYEFAKMCNDKVNAPRYKVFEMPEK